MLEIWPRVPSSNIIDTRERKGWIDNSHPGLKARRIRWTGLLMATAPRGLGEETKRFGVVQAPAGTLPLRADGACRRHQVTVLADAFRRD